MAPWPPLFLHLCVVSVRLLNQKFYIILQNIKQTLLSEYIKININLNVHNACGVHGIVTLGELFNLYFHLYND